MIDLRMLGTTELRREGQALDSFLTGPKRLGVLAYLALARPRGFQRRDELLPLFWPERGQKSARNALSNMLYHIRRELGEDVIVNRGAEEIGVQRDRLACDAIAFEEALDRGDVEQALDLYRGDLLQGFHVPDAAPAFDQWLDRERERLRRQAAEGAWACAEAAEDAGDAPAARSWAKKAAGFAPFSDEAQTRLVTLLKRIGDRTGAQKAYEAFAERLRTEWDMEPTDELTALVERMGSEAPGETASPQVTRGASAPDRKETIPAEALQDLSANPSAAPASSSEKTTPLRAASRSRWPVRRWGVAGGAALLVMLGMALSWAFEFGGSTQNSVPTVSNERSVAVLPFTYIGAEDSTDYFSLGMTEEILTRLAQVSDLSVISRTSVMQYRDTEKPLRTIGEELGASAVVEGSVQPVGDKVRITAQLIDARTDRHLWGASYNRRLEDILAVQSEVAQRIAGALQANLLPQEQAQLTTGRQVDETAYHLYLRAQHLRDRRDPAQMSRAAVLYREAITRDSTFASAHAGLAMASFWLGNIGMMDPDLTGAEGVPPETAGAEALQAADRALALDSMVAEAHLAKALVYERFQRAWKRSGHAFQRTLQLNPSHSEAREEYGWQLLRLGHVDSALVQMKRAVALDPLSSGAHHSLGYAYHSNYQYEEAIQEMETALDLGSGDPFTKKFLNVALLKRSQQLFREGRDEAAEAHLIRADELMDEIWGKNNERREVFELVLRDQRAEALRHLGQASLPPAHTTYILSLAGQSGPTLDMLEHHVTGILNFRVYADPIFDPARDDPQRFERIVERALRHSVDLH